MCVLGGGTWCRGVSNWGRRSVDRVGSSSPGDGLFVISIVRQMLDTQPVAPASVGCPRTKRQGMNYCEIQADAMVLRTSRRHRREQLLTIWPAVTGRRVESELGCRPGTNPNRKSACRARDQLQKAGTSIPCRHHGYYLRPQPAPSRWSIDLRDRVPTGPGGRRDQRGQRWNGAAGPVGRRVRTGRGCGATVQ